MDLNDANKCLTSLVSLINVSSGACTSLISKSIRTMVWSDQDILASYVSVTDASGVDFVKRFDDISFDLRGVFYLV